MSIDNSSDMDFLESELSILTVTDNLNSILQNYIDDNPNLVQHIDDKLLIVLSPLSLKHSFDRKWVTRRELQNVVEKPGRLLACSIGILALFTISPSNFDIISSNSVGSLYLDHVVKIHGIKWAKDLIQLCEDADSKLQHNQFEVPENWPRGDIYLNSETLELLQGVIGLIQTAVDQLYMADFLKTMIVVRPPGHHSHPCSPSGFCLINNAQITIQYAYEQYKITHAVILDIDLHHGDGSQEICWKRGGWKIEDDDDTLEFNDYYKRPVMDGPEVGYFSLHDINSYPTELGMAYSETIKNASTCLMSHDVNIWNVHLEKYETMEEFNKLYQFKYMEIIRKALQFLSKLKSKNDHFKPLVMISAGFDASEYETEKMQRHQVNVPTSFYHDFAHDVCELFSTISPEVKFASILEGGYSNEALCSGMFSHLLGLQNIPWLPEYGTRDTVRDLVKGCKPHWKPPMKPVLPSWIQDAIVIGRELIPGSIIDDKPPSSINNENILDRLRSHNKV